MLLYCPFVFPSNAELDPFCYTGQTFFFSLPTFQSHICNLNAGFQVFGEVVSIEVHFFPSVKM